MYYKKKWNKSDTDKMQVQIQEASWELVFICFARNLQYIMNFLSQNV